MKSLLFSFCLVVLTFKVQAAVFLADGHRVETLQSQSGLSFLVDGERYDLSNDILLKQAPFVASDQSQQDSQLFVVQFKTMIFQDYKTWLEQRGFEVIRFVPEHALLVKGQSSRIEELRVEPWVHDAFVFDSTYKMAGLPESLWLQPRMLTVGDYDILTVSKGASRQLLLNALVSRGAQVRRFSADAFAIKVFADLPSLQAIAADSDVLWIEPSPQAIEEDMDIVRTQGGATYLNQTMDNFYGEGVIGHVLEGIYPQHPDFAADEYRDMPIAVGTPHPSSHGHKTYGIIYGSGAGDERAMGLMPRAQGYYTNNDHVFNNDDRKALTKQVIEEKHVMLQTASWGYPTTKFYNARSLEMDEIIFELDIPITQSQSNTGTRESRPQAWAKNIISVGAVHHGNDLDFENDTWFEGGASIGPADDGRIKPEIVSYYDAIHTTGLSQYTTFGGTSAATPIVNGFLGLVIEMFTSGLLGNDLKHPKTDRFANRPHASTAKALLINSARQYAFEGLWHDLTRSHQGWGQADLKSLYESRDHIFMVNEDDVLKVLESKSYTIDVQEGAKTFAVTMAQTDPPGLVGTTRQRVNDLDLQVIAPDGTSYWGNYGLERSNFSKSGGEKDELNPMENVFIKDPQPGKWTVVVTAAEINSDGHVETEAWDADYALIVRYK